MQAVELVVVLLQLLQRERTSVETAAAVQAFQTLMEILEQQTQAAVVLVVLIQMQADAQAVQVVLEL
jgi:hypothetical protein